MNDTERNLRVGQQYLYEEDGGAERVKILEVKIRRGSLHVKFEILEVVRRGPFTSDKNVGRIVTVDKLKDAHCPGVLWEISPL